MKERVFNLLGEEVGMNGVFGMRKNKEFRMKKTKAAPDSSYVCSFGIEIFDTK